MTIRWMNSRSSQCSKRYQTILGICYRRSALVRQPSVLKNAYIPFPHESRPRESFFKAWRLSTGPICRARKIVNNSADMRTKFIRSLRALAMISFGAVCRRATAISAAIAVRIRLSKRPEPSRYCAQYVILHFFSTSRITVTGFSISLPDFCLPLRSTRNRRCVPVVVYVGLYTRLVTNRKLLHAAFLEEKFRQIPLTCHVCLK